VNWRSPKWYPLWLAVILLSLSPVSGFIGSLFRSVPQSQNEFRNWVADGFGVVAAYENQSGQKHIFLQKWSWEGWRNMIVECVYVQTRFGYVCDKVVP
jgi:hypothetical protein